MTNVLYDVYLKSAEFDLLHVADLAVDEVDGVLNQVGFRYRKDFLANAQAFPLDPNQFPLTDGELQLQCRNGIPALIDDYLPDDWGRRVMVRLARAREQTDFNANSVIDCLSLVGNSRIGAIAIVPSGQTPEFGLGEPVTAVAKAELAAQEIDETGYTSVDASALSLLYLANSGTGVGGARPKALLHDSEGAYLAKFNRQFTDPYNNARVELACLDMARAAGLEVTKGRVMQGINSREVLLLDRFDVTPDQRCHHLITVNGLLKDAITQRDVGQAFRYDMISELIATHVDNIEASLTQLLRLMLFNAAIHNTDDHERNFSLIRKGGEYHLSPAYDLVPSLTTGNYHSAGYGYSVDPPKPSEALKLGKIFGLSKTVVARVSEQVIDAVSNWQAFADEAGVSDEDISRVDSVLRQ